MNGWQNEWMPLFSMLLADGHEQQSIAYITFCTEINVLCRFVCFLCVLLSMSQTSSGETGLANCRKQHGDQRFFSVVALLGQRRMEIVTEKSIGQRLTKWNSVSKSASWTSNLEYCRVNVPENECWLNLKDRYLWVLKCLFVQYERNTLQTCKKLSLNLSCLLLDSWRLVPTQEACQALICRQKTWL